MGILVGILKRLLKLIVYSAIFITIILLIPNLPPYTKFTRIQVEPTQQLVGVLAPNSVLNNAEHLFKGKLLGPEAFQIYNDEVYTTLATGEIVKFSSGGHVTFVTKIGEPCTGLVQEHICGRPLGLVIDDKNKLMYVADAYYGIWKVNLATYKKQLLVSPRVAINGRKPNLFNSIALGQNGDLYWTDSSSDYQLRDGVFAIFSDPSGRLFHYDSVKNVSRVLLDDLWFANGLVVSPDNEFVVVAETNTQRLMKYYLNGPKRAKSEVFLAGLPGFPDNIRTLPDGSGILVSLYNTCDDENPLITKTLALTPLARKFIARVLHLIEISFQFLNNQFHHHIFEEVAHQIGNFASASFLTPKMSGLLQADWNGNIIAVYHNTDGSLLHISDAIVYKDVLYTGCPHTQDYVGAIPAPPLLKKAFSSIKPAVKEQPKLKVEEIPKESVKISKQQEKPPQKVNETPQQKKEAEVKPKVVTKQAEVKPKVVAKDAEVKPKVVTKESEVKPKVVTKEAEVKPKVVPKDADVKPKVVTKATEVKPQVVPDANAKKPVVVSKEAEKKSNPPTKAPEVKVVPKEKDTKPKDTDKVKPDPKETEAKAKLSKDANLKSKTESKETAQAKTGPKQVNIHPDIKVEYVQKDSKDKNQNTEENTKSDESVPKIVTKPIPVEEKIPSDTAKPNKETLKVIKKSGPQEIPNPNV